MSDRRTWLLLALVLWTGCASSWCGLKGPAGAFERLRAAESVRSSHVDAAGAPTCEWEAFRVLSRSTDDLWFRRLVLEADAPGRLYGLGGLALLAGDT